MCVCASLEVFIEARFGTLFVWDMTLGNRTPDTRVRRHYVPINHQKQTNQLTIDVA